MSPFLLKDIFTEYIILRWQFFSFRTWKMLCHFLMASMDEKTVIIQNYFSCIGNAQFLSAFKIIFLAFSFQMFDYDVSWHGVLEFILLGIHSVSWAYRFMSFTKVDKFWAIFLQVFFQPRSPSPLLLWLEWQRG